MPTARAAAFASALVAVGALIGIVTGLAGQTLYLVGLYEIAAGLCGAFAAVALAHLTDVRGPRAHAAAAAGFAVVWMLADLGTDAVAMRLAMARRAASAGVLLADEAVLRDSDDPLALVDATLQAETGASGWRGAARLRLARGLPVLRAGAVTRVVRMPAELQVALIGLRAAVVALLLARALAQLRAEPRCAACATALRRRRLGYVDDATAARLAADWAAGLRTAPAALPARAAPASGARTLALEDRCPRGCSVTPGFSLLRERRVGFGSGQPGPLASVPPTTAEVNGSAAVEA